MKITVGVVEDDTRIRESVGRIIDVAEGFSCVGSFKNAEVALKEIPRLKPNVVLMDINLPGMSGVDCVRELKIVAPTVRIIMFTVYDEPEQLFKSLMAGACGYLLKRTPPEKLLESIAEASRGGSPMNRQIASMMVEYFHSLGRALPEMETLTRREHETLALLADGYRYKEIAEKMHISLPTVSEYVSNIYQKLHVTSRTEAVVKFLRAQTQS
jgi:DNA-binding NarL/FixJ family response regulator